MEVAANVITQIGKANIENLPSLLLTFKVQIISEMDKILHNCNGAIFDISLFFSEENIKNLMIWNFIIYFYHRWKVNSQNGKHISHFSPVMEAQATPSGLIRMVYFVQKYREIFLLLCKISHSWGV